MLQSVGVQWQDLPVCFRRGVYFKRIKRFTQFTADELERLPEKHHARLDPNLVFERSEIMQVELPRLADAADKSALLFGDDLVADKTQLPQSPCV